MAKNKPDCYDKLDSYEDFSACFDEKTKNMTRQKKLYELFELWKYAHEHEDDESYEADTPEVYVKMDGDKKIDGKRVAKTSFCPDGLLFDTKPDDVNVLFILKESKITDRKKSNYDDPRGKEEFFWFKSVVKGQEQSSAAIRYRQRLQYAAMAAGCSAFPNNCAYMNINKRGGTGGCDAYILSAYMDQPVYRMMIAKEISIIHPDLIICCSTDKNLNLEGHLKRIIEEYNPDSHYTYVSIFHPGYTWKKENQHQAKVREVFGIPDELK